MSALAVPVGRKLFLVFIALAASAMPYFWHLGDLFFEATESIPFTRLAVRATHEMLFIGIAISLSAGLEVAEGISDLKMIGNAEPLIASVFGALAVSGGVGCIFFYVMCIGNAAEFVGLTKKATYIATISFWLVVLTVLTSALSQVALSCRKCLNRTGEVS